MTRRQTESEEFQWKITMTHRGAFSYGAGWSVLIDYVHDCYRRGACFKVEMKKLHPLDRRHALKGWTNDGHVTVDEHERCTGWKSRDVAVGLADGVVDEESL